MTERSVQLETLRFRSVLMKDCKREGANYRAGGSTRFLSHAAKRESENLCSH
jgi:hypothetical protein